MKRFIVQLTEWKEEKGKQVEALGKMSVEERAVYAKNLAILLILGSLFIEVKNEVAAIAMTICNLKFLYGFFSTICCLFSVYCALFS